MKAIDGKADFSILFSERGDQLERHVRIAQRLFEYMTDRFFPMLAFQQDDLFVRPCRCGDNLHECRWHRHAAEHVGFSSQQTDFHP